MRSRMKLFATEDIDAFVTEDIDAFVTEGIGLQHSHLSAISFPERLLESNRPSSDFNFKFDSVNVCG